MQEVHRFLPEIDIEEAAPLIEIFGRLQDDQKHQFAMMYRARRRDTTHILLFTLLGFLGIAGVQRFMIGQIAIGIIYFLTAGLCFIGTIVDLINYKTLATDYNRQQAYIVLSYMNIR